MKLNQTVMKKRGFDALGVLTRWFENNHWWFVCGILLLIFIRLSLGDFGTMELIAPHDDSLFLEQAYHILSGRWLGKFNHMTLGKSPLYPCLIALSIYLGIPYTGFRDLLLCLSCLAGVQALRPVQNRFFSLLMFAGIIFCPSTFFTQRVLIQDFYASMMLGLVFCLAGLLIRCGKGTMACIPWIIGSGFYFTMLLLMREESMAMISLFVVTGIALLIKLRRLDKSWKQIVMHFLSLYVLIPVFIFQLISLPIKLLNYRHYKMFCTTIRNEREYKLFIGSILGAAKILDSDWDIRIPLKYDVLDKLYEYSPTLATLRPFIDKSDNWHLGGVQRFPKSVLEENPALLANTKGGWVQWELLAAMQNRGLFSSSHACRLFLRNVVKELEGASQAGALPGFKVRCSNLVPFDMQMVDWFFRKFSREYPSLFSWNHFVEIPFVNPPFFPDAEKNVEIKFLYSMIRSTPMIPVSDFVVTGWGYDPNKMTGLNKNNFILKNNDIYTDVERGDVQQYLLNNGKNISGNLGFVLYLHSSHLVIKDDSGKIIFDKNLNEKTKSDKAFLFFDRIESRGQRFLVKKREFIRSYCWLFKNYGGIFSALTLLFLLLGVILWFKRKNSHSVLLPMWSAGGLLWIGGFIYFSLIILANVMLHCPRAALYYIPASLLLYCGNMVFIISFPAALYETAKRMKR